MYRRYKQMIINAAVSGAIAGSHGSQHKMAAQDSIEHRALEAGGPRVLFDATWKGEISTSLPDDDDVITKITQEMSPVLAEIEKAGVAPVLPDGKVGGNAAVLYKDGHVVVSKSGKDPGMTMRKDDFCVVTNFDESAWSADYYSCNAKVLPTSDTPMHFSTLQIVPSLGWDLVPRAILHGHALATEEEAERYGFPCSTEETRCSTPADKDALIGLLRRYPYPQHKVYIRKGHGFILLGQDIRDAVETFRTLIVPYL